MNFLRNRGTIQLTLPLTAMLLLGNCTFLGSLGLPAPGTISGSEVKSKAADSALLGVVLGISTYCSQFTNPSSCESAFSDARSTGMALAFAATPDSLPVDEGTYYGTFQGEACASAVLLNFWFLTSAYIGTKEEIVTVNGSSVVTIPDVDAAINEAVLFNVALAGSACEGGLNSTESSSESGGESSSSSSDSSSSALPALRGAFQALQ